MLFTQMCDKSGVAEHANSFCNKPEKTLHQTTEISYDYDKIVFGFMRRFVMKSHFIYWKKSIHLSILQNIFQKVLFVTKK